MMNKKPQNTNRDERIASAVQRFVAEILRDNYANDPALARVTIVDARASHGLTFVHLYYYVHGGDNEMVQKKLDSITPWVRHELAARMNQKYTPEIKFHFDDTLDRAARIDDLLNKL